MHHMEEKTKQPYVFYLRMKYRRFSLHSHIRKVSERVNVMV